VTCLLEGETAADGFKICYVFIHPR
jgi:hypothetical protein